MSVYYKTEYSFTRKYTFWALIPEKITLKYVCKCSLKLYSSKPKAGVSLMTRRKRIHYGMNMLWNAVQQPREADPMCKSVGRSPGGGD